MQVDAIPAALLAAAELVEADLARRLEAAALPRNLRDAVCYSVLNGGKRLRPALALLACRAVGGDDEAALPAAGAIELIHCFSLVHDDLPAMDDDDLRRGRPTLHVHAGEAMAVLAGDVMVSLAFTWLAETGPGATSGRSRDLVAELAAATTAMIAGQVYDTIGGFPPGADDRRRLQLIHEHKTAALIRAACRMGGIAGGASARHIAALSRFGEATGVMYQIVDDLLDVTQSAEHTGKATGKDQPAGKLTFPGLLGVEASQAEVRRLVEEARGALAELGAAARPLVDLCDFLAVRTR